MRRGRPLKRWRYVAFFSDELMGCAATVQIGPARQTFWALLDRTSGELRERTRLAREMHDTVGHALVLISIKLEAARRLRERDPERCDRELEATGEIARATMNDLRASIANLRSPALEREPACRALSRYAREMAQRASSAIIEMGALELVPR